MTAFSYFYEILISSF